MIPVNQTVKKLYEQIISLHEFVDPNISAQFYLNRMEAFTQLSLLFEEYVIYVTNVSSKVREIVLNIRPQRVYTIENNEIIEEAFPTEILVECKPEKKLTITSMGFGDNNILREKSLNSKPVRRQKQSQQLFRQPKDLKQNKFCKQVKHTLPEINVYKDLDKRKLITQSLKQIKHSVTQQDQHTNSRCMSIDPFGDEQIYIRNIQMSRIDKNPRKKKILSICVKGQNSPNLFIN